MAKRTYIPPSMSAYQAASAWGQDTMFGACVDGSNPSGYTCSPGGVFSTGEACETGSAPGLSNCNNGTTVGNPVSCSSGGAVSNACSQGDFVSG